MRFSTREDVISITPLNPFDRFDDGRPKVPDDLTKRMKLIFRSGTSSTRAN